MELPIFDTKRRKIRTISPAHEDKEQQVGITIPNYIAEHYSGCLFNIDANASGLWLGSVAPRQSKPKHPNCDFPAGSVA